MNPKSTLKDLLLLGDPRLYESCAPIESTEIDKIPGWIDKMQEVMDEIKRRYRFGRGIAAPQLGIMKRLVLINIENPWILINPQVVNHGKETFELWDDCMSLPLLLVKVERHKEITIKYRDLHWDEKEITLGDDLSELLQHEIDHLNGILCTMRAIDSKSFKWKGIISNNEF